MRCLRLEAPPQGYVSASGVVRMSELSALVMSAEEDDLHAILPSFPKLAHERLKSDRAFRALFDNGRECQAVVVSVDIRRSTELMLKATDARGYAAFVTKLCSELRDLVHANFGVFDKFTGDGVLASFPEDFSGPEAIGHALVFAKQAHLAFRALYDEHRSAFQVVPRNTGLGIGIDFGTVSLVRIGRSLTSVGRPVVYACRLAAVPAHTTALNQQARDRAVAVLGKAVQCPEADLKIKNDDEHVIYSAIFAELRPRRPHWAEGAI